MSAGCPPAATSGTSLVATTGLEPPPVVVMDRPTPRELARHLRAELAARASADADV